MLSSEEHVRGLADSEAEEAAEEFADAYPIYFSDPADLIHAVKSIEQRALELISANQSAQQTLSDLKARRRLAAQRLEDELETLRAELRGLEGPATRGPERPKTSLLASSDAPLAQLHGLVEHLHGELVRKSGKEREFRGRESGHQLSLLQEIESALLALLQRTVLGPGTAERGLRNREIRKRMPKITEQIQQEGETKSAKPKLERPALPRSYFRVRRDARRYALTSRKADESKSLVEKKAKVEDVHFK